MKSYEFKNVFMNNLLSSYRIVKINPVIGFRLNEFAIDE